MVADRWARRRARRGTPLGGLAHAPRRLLARETGAFEWRSARTPSLKFSRGAPGRILATREASNKNGLDPDRPRSAVYNMVSPNDQSRRPHRAAPVRAATR